MGVNTIFNFSTLKCKKMKRNEKKVVGTNIVGIYKNVTNTFTVKLIFAT